MSKQKSHNIEITSLLIPDNLSTEQKEYHSELVSKHLSRFTDNASNEGSPSSRSTEITITDDMLDEKEFEVEKITNDELFQILQQDYKEISSDISFPKTTNINKLFWLLHNLIPEETEQIRIINIDDLSIKFYQLIEAAMFFRFLTVIKTKKEIYLIPTDIYKEFLSKPIADQYIYFLKILGSNETISEGLIVQVNDSIFDRISRRRVYNMLVKDSNIQKESLIAEEIEEIVNDLRLWYLNIRNTILED